MGYKEVVSGPKLVAVMGPTGSGKSAVAERLADKWGAVLVNADAFQVYQGFDIGTNKPENRERYELIDICEAEEQFGVGEWLRRVEGMLQTAWDAQQDVIVVGGTGLYIRALFEGYAEMSGPPDPELRQELMRREAEEGLGKLVEQLEAVDPEMAGRVDLRNGVRVRRALEKVLGGGERIQIEVPDFRKFKFGLDVEVEALRQRLEKRLLEMVDGGWIEEVRKLNDINVSENAPAMRAIGYHSWRCYLSGATTFDEAFAEVLKLTVQYAKRQRTWMRREPNLKMIALQSWDEAGIEAAVSAIRTSID
ncbi:tRNA (adenosine(37)-N6)-dimethylallyltransferase MiaA [Armatimonadetes bacterium Uphvl-Ar1]|nr:tRNA (adenosine(37)-N6)-dimethylallyltransferase MiaA [Armatimonadetes bacterium Uphvl-Ar1]